MHRKIVFLSIIALTLVACGHHKKKAKPITTPLDGDWKVMDARKALHDISCDTRLIVGEGKALLSETCDGASWEFHVVGFGPVKVKDDSYIISPEVSCPSLETVTYPRFSGKYSLSVVMGLKRLTLSDSNGSPNANFLQINQEKYTSAARVGCFDEYNFLTRNDNWSFIGQFVSHVLTSIDQD